MDHTIYDDRVLLYWTVDTHGKKVSVIRGQDVRSANSVGVVVTLEASPLRSLIPWHMVINLTYHTKDRDLLLGDI